MSDPGWVNGIVTGLPYRVQPGGFIIEPLGTALWAYVEPQDGISAVNVSVGGGEFVSIPPDGQWHRFDVPGNVLSPAPPPFVLSADLIGDADIVDVDLAAERERLAADRANRQTLAWRYGMDELGRPLPTPDDPTTILDADDPWLP